MLHTLDSEHWARASRKHPRLATVVEAFVLWLLALEVDVVFALKIKTAASQLLFRLSRLVGWFIGLRFYLYSYVRAFSTYFKKYVTETDRYVRVTNQRSFTGSFGDRHCLLAPAVQFLCQLGAKPSRQRDYDLGCTSAPAIDYLTVCFLCMRKDGNFMPTTVLLCSCSAGCWLKQLGRAPKLALCSCFCLGARVLFCPNSCPLLETTNYVPIICRLGCNIWPCSMLRLQPRLHLARQLHWHWPAVFSTRT